MITRLGASFEGGVTALLMGENSGGFWLSSGSLLVYEHVGSVERAGVRTFF